MNWRAPVRVLTSAMCFVVWASSTTAIAQSLLISPELPDDFDRGKNVSVLQQPRPGYDPVGFRIGAFEVFPEIELNAGATDNVYFQPGRGKSDSYLQIAPVVKILGDLSPVIFDIRAEASIQKFMHESSRNQDTWIIRPSGRIDISEGFRVLVDVHAAREAERPTSGEVDPEVAVLSRYMNLFARVRGQYEAGQIRTTLAIDYSVFDFSNVRLSNGETRSQTDRDRNVRRITVQSEYAFSPSFAVFARVSNGKIKYDRMLADGALNRDSSGWRISAGVNMDLTKLLRGTVGVGYTWRDYNAATYRDVDGLSITAQLEYFPTELTTLTARFRRTLQDSNLRSSQAFFDNRFSLGVDHALLRNLTVSVEGQYGKQSYVVSNAKTKLYAFSGAVNYALSSWIGVRAGLRYADRNRANSGLLNSYREFQGSVGVVLQR